MAAMHRGKEIQTTQNSPFGLHNRPALNDSNQHDGNGNQQ
jgi:hypothetical protein